jgi:hypothetical protein
MELAFLARIEFGQREFVAPDRSTEAHVRVVVVTETRRRGLPGHGCSLLPGSTARCRQALEFAGRIAGGEIIIREGPALPLSSRWGDDPAGQPE